MANGKYVSAANNGASALIAQSTSVGTQESFAAALVVTSPPVAPALSGNPGKSEVVLNWTAPATATGYNVKWSLDRGGPYSYAVIQSNIAAA